MLNSEESVYFERWNFMQRTQQFHKRLILSLIGLLGILSLIIMFAGNESPLVIERNHSVYHALVSEKVDLKPSKEAVAELLAAFIKIRYEWENFDPQVIVKKMEPVTTGALRDKLMEEFGKKSFQNRSGESIEQTVSRIRPLVSEKSVMATFDRILRINGVPVVVPTEISILLSEGPKTFFNPLGLYVNGVMEHEDR